MGGMFRSGAGGPPSSHLNVGSTYTAPAMCEGSCKTGCSKVSSDVCVHIPVDLPMGHLLSGHCMNKSGSKCPMNKCHVNKCLVSKSSVM